MNAQDQAQGHAQGHAQDQAQGQAQEQRQEAPDVDEPQHSTHQPAVQATTSAKSATAGQCGVSPATAFQEPAGSGRSGHGGVSRGGVSRGRAALGSQDMGTHAPHGGAGSKRPPRKRGLQDKQGVQQTTSETVNQPTVVKNIKNRPFYKPGSKKRSLKELEAVQGLLKLSGPIADYELETKEVRPVPNLTKWKPTVKGPFEERRGARGSQDSSVTQGGVAPLRLAGSKGPPRKRGLQHKQGVQQTNSKTSQLTVNKEMRISPLCTPVSDRPTLRELGAAQSLLELGGPIEDYHIREVLKKIDCPKWKPTVKRSYAVPPLESFTVCAAETSRPQPNQTIIGNLTESAPKTKSYGKKSVKHHQPNYSTRREYTVTPVIRTYSKVPGPTVRSEKTLQMHTNENMNPTCKYAHAQRTPLTESMTMRDNTVRCSTSSASVSGTKVIERKVLVVKTWPSRNKAPELKTVSKLKKIPPQVLLGISAESLKSETTKPSAGPPIALVSKIVTAAGTFTPVSMTPGTIVNVRNAKMLQSVENPAIVADASGVKTYLYKVNQFFRKNVEDGATASSIPTFSVPGPRDPICTVCYRRFSNNSNLLRHVSKVHKVNVDALRNNTVPSVGCDHRGGPPASCGNCSKSIAEELGRNEKSDYECTWCNKSYTTLAFLMKHLDASVAKGGCSHIKPGDVCPGVTTECTKDESVSGVPADSTKDEGVPGLPSSAPGFDDRLATPVD